MTQHARHLTLLVAALATACADLPESSRSSLAGAERVVITPAMVHPDDPSVYIGNYEALFDEQEVIGDPLDGEGAPPVTNWNEQSWRDADYPVGIYIDLGSEHDVTQVGVFDTYNTDTIYFDVGSPGAWTNVVTHSTTGWQSWATFSVTARTRYVHFRREMFAGVNELVIYATPVGASEPEPGVPAKIAIDASMIRLDPTLGAVGDYQAMVDEQELAGDPLAGSGGAPVTGWSNQSWRPEDYPAGFYLDLGREYVITHVGYYDVHNTDWVYFDTGSPDSWTRRVAEQTDGWQTWELVEIGVRSRYLRYSRAMFTGVSEIVVYGYPAEGEAENVPPTVSAGAAQTVTLPTAAATLHGSASDADGTVASVEWVQTSGPSAAIVTGADSLTATASGLVEGTYEFELEAIDDDGAHASAATTVTVIEPPTGEGELGEHPASPSTPGGYGYVSYVPAGYASRSDWPLVLFLHGSGERGNGSASEVRRVWSQGPPRYADEGEPYPFVLIAPQTNGSWGDYEIEHNLEAFLDHILDTYGVDPRRVYLTGLSLGGSGTLAYAALHPERFAAVVPVCPGAWNWSDAAAQRMVDAGLAVWGAHSLNDGTIPFHATSPWFDALGHALGASGGVMDAYPASGETNTASFDAGWHWTPGQGVVAGSYPLRFTVYRTGGHGIWGRMYEDPGLWSWLLAQRRL